MNDESLEASISATLSQYAGGLIESLRKNLNLAELCYIQNPSHDLSDNSDVSVRNYELLDAEERFIGAVDVEERKVGDAVLIRVTYEGAFPRVPIGPEEKYEKQRQFKLIAKNTLEPFETATVVSEWDREDKYLGIPLVHKIQEKTLKAHITPGAGLYQSSNVAEERIVIESATGPAKRKVDADDISAENRLKEEILRRREEAARRQAELAAIKRARMSDLPDMTLDINDPRVQDPNKPR
jgi:hypothetical protein